MSRSSYTAAERRGIILIALLSLAIIAAGLGFTWCGREEAEIEEKATVIQHPELIDTVAIKNKRETDAKRSSNKKNKSSKKKSTPPPRKRSPLDEPV